MQTIKQRSMIKSANEFYAGRTEYRESDYRFARTCPGFYPEPDARLGDKVVLGVSVVIVVCLILLAASGVAV